MGQTISSTQFYLYGRKHFTKTGHAKHSKLYQDLLQTSAVVRSEESGADGVTLRDKVVVVTGANSGLGKEVASYAAAKGAKLYMLCRNQERAEAARKEIVDQTLNKNVEIVLADVSELTQIRNAVKELQSKEPKIDALVCNAGVLLHDRRLSSEGHELTFASHLLGGSYLLSQLLLPQLKAAGKEARVIFVTSGGMYNFAVPPWDVLTSAEHVKFNGVNVYAYCKRAQVLLAERMAKNEPEVLWVTAHPGWADTNAVDASFGDQKKYLMPLREPWEGAEGMAWLLGAPRSKLESGALYLDRTVQPKHLAGPCFSEGSFTKNTSQEVDELLNNLRTAAGLQK